MTVRLMDENEARAWESGGRFMCQVVAHWHGDKIGIGHDWDHAIDRCYVYVLRGGDMARNPWEPLAGPFSHHRAAAEWVDKLIGWPR